MFFANRPLPAVIVEYDCNGQRVQKHFTDPYQARRFYASKLKAGKCPKVLAASSAPAKAR